MMDHLVKTLSPQKFHACPAQHFTLTPLRAILHEAASKQRNQLSHQRRLSRVEDLGYQTMVAYPQTPEVMFSKYGGGGVRGRRQVGQAAAEPCGGRFGEPPGRGARDSQEV